MFDRPEKLIPAVIVTAVVTLILFVFVINFEIIEPGYTGLRIPRMAKGAVTADNTVAGCVIYSPLFTKVFQLPVFNQRVVWTKEVTEGSINNDEINFNTKDSIPVTTDISVSYNILASKAHEFYTQFRTDDMETFTTGYLKDTIREAFVKVGSRYTFEAMNGKDKELFLGEVMEYSTKALAGYGVNLKQVSTISALRPPADILKAVNDRSKSIQESIQVENELRKSVAAAKKRVADAEGQAAANRALISSLDPRLIEWEKLKLQREAIEEWDGKLPTVVSGNQGMLFNIPTTIK